MLASGLNALLIPVRGQMEGFSAAWLGVVGAAWAIGYMAGCLQTPRLVAQVGHVRAFGALCALSAIAVLLSLLLIAPAYWAPLRALSGFCVAGGAMVVES